MRLIQVMIILTISGLLFYFYERMSTDYQPVQATMIQKYHEHTDAYYTPRYDAATNTTVLDFNPEEDYFNVVYQTPLGQYTFSVDESAFDVAQQGDVINIECGISPHSKTLFCR